MYTLVAYYFGIYDEVEKPVGDESQELPARNFERVEVGEAYAKSKEGFSRRRIVRSGPAVTVGTRWEIRLRGANDR